MDKIVKILVGLFILILSGVLSAKAQTTNAVITISNQSFPERSDFGESIRIVSLTFIINGNIIGSYDSFQLNSSDNKVISRAIPLSTDEINPSIQIYYIHHTWGVFGDHTYNCYHTYSLDEQFSDADGLMSEKVFNKFLELDMLPEWGLTYKIKFTPFQPVIGISDNFFCNKKAYSFTLDPNKAFFYNNSDVNYIWQYGVFTYDWIYNDLFYEFCDNLKYQLFSLCISEGGFDCYNISIAIDNTNFSYMESYYSLYDDIEGNRGVIAQLLLYGILYQQNSILTYENSEFLCANFLNVVQSAFDCPAPYLPDNSVKNWSTFGVSSSGPIDFNTIGSISDITRKTTYGFRAIAYKLGNPDNIGPISSPLLIDIYPTAPSGIPGKVNACPDKNDGVFKLSNITGVDPGNFYTFIYKKNNDPSCTAITINGTNSAEINGLSYGSYTGDLVYSNSEIDRCATNYYFEIGMRNQLNYSLSTSDVSCPDGKNGMVNVDLISWEGISEVRFNNIIFTNLDGVFGSLSKGYYELNIADYCNTVPILIPFVIKGPSQVVIESSIPQAPTCLANPNGSIEVKVSGGTGSYEYELLNDQNNSIFSTTGQGSLWRFNSLSGGNYVVKAGVSGCSWGPETYNYLQTVQPLSVTVKKTDVSCFGVSSGEIFVNAVGGSGPPYIFSFDEQEYTSGSVFQSVPAGIHLVKVRSDNLLCKDVISQNVTIETASEIKINLIPIDVTCNGYDDGQISLTSTGGTGSHKVKWDYYDAGNWYPIMEVGSYLTGLLPGRYRVTITDGNDCKKAEEVIILEPQPLSIKNVVKSDIVCSGERGKVKINVQGGNDGYKYTCSEKEGTIYENYLPEILVPSGTYSIKVSDNEGCMTRYSDPLTFEDITIEITEPSGKLDFTSAISNHNGYEITCYGYGDGTILMNAFGGNGDPYNGYTYSLSRSDIPDRNDGFFSGLYAGLYNLKVTDGRGCVSLRQVELKQPSSLYLSLLSVDPVNCFGTATGSIAVEAKGSIGPLYEYYLNGNVPSSDGLFKDLFSDNYNVTAIDRNGCSQNITIDVINKNPPIQTKIIPKDIRCFGENNGEIESVVSGGSGRFNIEWEKKTGGNWETIISGTSNPGNLNPGTYRLFVVDSDNCFTYDSTIIKEPDSLSFSNILLHDIVCYGDSGSIDIEASGGNDEYRYFLSNDNKKAYSEYKPGNRLSASTYYLKVTDLNGCESVWPQSIAVTQPDGILNMSYYTKDFNGFNVSCYGNNDGQIIINPLGGNGSGYSGYKYQLSGQMEQFDNTFNNLLAGGYEVILSDARGCKAKKQIILTQANSDLFIKASSIKPVTCVNDSDGSIILETKGGTFPYLYSINDNDFIEQNNFGNLTTGNYHFRVKDVNGCTQSFDTYIGNLIPEMNITGVITNVKCFGENNGRIDVAVDGGISPYNYRWDLVSSDYPAISNLVKGTYTIYIKDSDGCVNTKSFEITEPEYPLSISAFSKPACVSLQNGSIFVSSSGGTEPYIFSVDNIAKSFSTGNFSVYAGKHKIFVTDLHGCRESTDVIVEEKNTLPDVNFMLASKRYELDTLVVIDVSSPAPDSVSWEFSPDADIIETNAFDAKVKYNFSGLFPVKMTGHFANCDYSIEKKLDIASFDPDINAKDKFRIGIKSVLIKPNPNEGNFRIQIELFSKQQITIKVIDYYSNLWMNTLYPADTFFDKEITLQNVIPGTYILWIVSENDSRSVVFIVSH
jgi:hypothetical protein